MEGHNRSARLSHVIRTPHLTGLNSGIAYNWGRHSAILARLQKRPLGKSRLPGDLHFTPRYTFDHEHAFGAALRERIMHGSGLSKRYLEQAVTLVARGLFADLQSRTGRVSYSRRHDFYSAPPGHEKPFVRYAGMMQCVAALAEAGIAHSEISPPWPAGRGKQSAFCLTSGFAQETYRGDWFASLRLVPRPAHDLVVVRDRESGKVLPWPDAATGTRLSAELAAINAHLLPAVVRVPDRFVDQVTDDGETLAVFNPAHPDRQPVIISPNKRRRLYMPFRDSFDLGGRPVGWDAQIIPSPVRIHCTLYGEPVNEIDFSGSHIALAYIDQGYDVPLWDPYEAICEETGCERAVAKRTALVALNASNPHEALGAVYSYMVERMDAQPEDKDHERALWADAELVLSTFQKVHAPIANLIATDFGVKAQNAEANIMLGCLHGAQRKAFHVIPMHDGLCGPERRTDEMISIAHEAWTNVTGAKPPKIKVEKKEEETGKESNSPPHVWDAFSEQT
jgi:hypothetical protein